MGMNPRLLRPTPTGFDPRRIAGLALWLDASATSSLTFNGNTVSEWRDLSGNGRHFDQATAANQPNATTRTQNGRRVLDFDGSTTRLVGNAATLNLARNVSAMTIVAVGAFDVTTAPAGQGGRYLLFMSRGDNALSARLTFGATAFTGGIPAGFQLFGRRNDADAFQTVTSTPDTSPHVFTATGNYGAALANLRIDGTTTATTNPWLTAGNTPDNSSLSVSIGFDGASGNHTDGFIGELVVFQKALTVAEAFAVERYLGSKWGITVA
jgi:hypothetical protein